MVLPEQEAGLAHTAVADDEELEHVVEVLIGRVLLTRVILGRHLKDRRGKIGEGFQITLVPVPHTKF